MQDDRTTLMAARALSPGYEILWYTIKKVLGQGGFGITYLAYDRNLDRSVAIKEYLPSPFAYRHRDFSVKPLTGDHRDQFAWGLDSFQREAQTLAKFGHDNIVRVHSVFERNNTAYMVMEYEDGENLSSIYKKQRGQFDEGFFQQIFFPIFDGLKEIHKFGFIHRDIKPANIFIRENRTPVLIDFGSARQTSNQQTDEMTALVTRGYTPLEQYSSNYGDQGPWTDIYALAATMYEGVVGKRPEESLGRSACILKSKPDLIQRLKSEEYTSYTQPFLDALIKGLELEPDDRPSDLNTWLAMFYSNDKTLPVQPGSYRMPGRADPKVNVVPLRKSESRSSSAAQRQRADDDTPKRSSKPRPESLTKVLARGQRPEPADSTRMRAAREFELGLDELNFDDDPHDRMLHHDDDDDWDDDYDEDYIDESRQKWVGIAAVGLLLSGVAVAFWLYTDAFKTPSVAIPKVNAALVRSLPTPTTQVPVSLPKELIMQQLATLSSMAALYSKVATADPTNAEVKAGVDAAYQKLIAIANGWSASHHPSIAEGIRRVSEQLPPSDELNKQLTEIVNESDRQSDFESFQQQLSSGRISGASGKKLVELVSTLSRDDRRRIESTEQWQKMLQAYRKSAIAKIRALDFINAAHVIAAGLTLQPKDSELLLLRQHLER